MVVASALPVPAAHASTVASFDEVDHVAGLGPDLMTRKVRRLLYEAGPGEINDVTIRQMSAKEVRIEDSAPLTPGENCRAGTTAKSAICDVVTVRKLTGELRDNFESAWVRLGDRNDTLHIKVGSDAFVADGPGDDVVISAGTSDRTILVNGPGNDVLRGAGFAPTGIVGGPCYSHYFSNKRDPGCETRIGGFGYVTGAGNYAIYSVSDGALLYGGPGNDRLYGGGGRDFLSGETGDDSLYGGRGDDCLNGGPGHNKLIGGPGKNTLFNKTQPGFPTIKCFVLYGFQ